MRKYSVITTKQAQRDIREITKYYIDSGSVIGGKKVAKKIRAAIRQLKIFPELNRRLEGTRDIRIAMAKPYNLYIQVVKRDYLVRVLRVIHMARNVNQAEIEDF